MHATSRNGTPSLTPLLKVLYIYEGTVVPMLELERLLACLFGIVD